MNLFKPSTWFSKDKQEDEPIALTSEVPEPLITDAQPKRKLTVDEINKCERIRAMHLGPHPTSRFLPINIPGISSEEAVRRGRLSWWEHTVGSDVTPEEHAYALSEQFQIDKQEK